LVEQAKNSENQQKKDNDTLLNFSVPLAHHNPAQFPSIDTKIPIETVLKLAGFASHRNI